MLIGHTYRYAIEQMVFTLFPGQSVCQSVSRGETEDILISTLDDKARCAHAKLTFQGQTASASAPYLPVDGDDGVRTVQHALKTACYLAAIEILGAAPPWGSLTGVRPAKIPTAQLEKGATAQMAEKDLSSRYFVSPVRASLAVQCAQYSVDTKKSMGKDTVSVYIGIPFCPSRCYYCSFVSADISRALSLLDPFVDALVQEIEVTGRMLKSQGKTISCLYFGGGTPTTLSAAQLRRVMAAVHKFLPLSLCELTVEAGRPDTITAEKLSVLQEHGVTRISINPQTMQPAVLETVGRNHTVAQVYDAFHLARDAGFSVINMDVIAGLEKDDLNGFSDTLASLISLAPENITVHTLSVKRGSFLHADGKLWQRDDKMVEMLDFSINLLYHNGYQPYYLYRQKNMRGGLENVGWCKTGTHSIYNICMMEELQSIVALGGGAMTKLVSKAGEITRHSNPKYPQDYIANLSRVLAQKENLVLT